jgi:hypothetical protein
MFEATNYNINVIKENHINARLLLHYYCVFSGGLLVAASTTSKIWDVKQYIHMFIVLYYTYAISWSHLHPNPLPTPIALNAVHSACHILQHNFTNLVLNSVYQVINRE